ncbi:Eml5, partial [Symbiodinium natans]
MAGMKTLVKSLFHFAIYDGGLQKQSGVLLKFYSLDSNRDLKGSAAIFGKPAPRHVLFCSWTSDGRCLASCDNGYLYIFEGHAATSSQRISTSALGFCVELPDQRLLAGSRDSVLHFLPASGSGNARARPLRDLGAALLCSAGPVPFASASAGPAVLAGSTNHHLLLIDAAEERLKQVLQVGSAGEVHALAVHPSPELQLFVTGSSDATVRFWDSRDHSPVVGRVLDYSRDQYWWPEGQVPKDGKGIYALALSSSGKLLALGHGEGTLRLLSFPELQAPAVACASKQRERISALIFVDDSLLIAGCWDQLIYIFDTSGLKCLRVLKGNCSSVTQMQISADSSYVMSNAKDGQVLFFDVRTGERVAAPAVREQSWRRWCCPAGWATTGIWSANRNFGIVDVKCCTNLRANEGHQLLASGDTSHGVQLFGFPALEGQGHHVFDGHAGFVTAMAPIPGSGELAEDKLITAGGDDHALL